MEHFDTIVLGAGITGLSSAYHVCKQGKKVIILEKSTEVGGALAGYKRPGYTIDKYYHHIFQSDTAVLNLARELGIENKIRFYQPVSGFYFGTASYPLKGIADLATFSPLSWWDKFRFCTVMARIKFLPAQEALDSMSALEWLDKYTSKGVKNAIFLPLLRLKFGDHYTKASALWLIERIRLRMNTGSKGEILGYITNGFKTLADALQTHYVEAGGELQLSAAVTRISKENSTFQVETANCTYSADTVVSTIPPKIFTQLYDLPKDYSERIANLPYQGAICIVIGLKKSLGKQYWVNVIEPRLIFGAYLEHTNFVPYNDYGENIVYLASYHPQSSKLWSMEKAEVFELYFADLQKINPIQRDEVLWYEVGRYPYASLDYTMGVKKMIPRIESPIPGLYVGGIFTSYPERTTNLSIETGQHIAEKIMQVLQNSTPS